MKLKTKGKNSILWLALFLSGYSILTQNSPSIAQIIPDDTLGSEASVVNQINETLQQIDGGALRGENLFHSFLEFSINEGNTVYFSNPADVINIFSRVTGNNISNILGTLGVSGNANLYFVNPNGILFGSSASIDIAGSFVANSGSAFIINGMEYSATNPQGVPLLTVTATAPVGLKLEGSEGIITNQAQLTAGNNLTLAGNQLDLQGQILAQGDLTLQASDSIKIQNATIDVRGNEGGSINASAKNISIQNSFVFAGIGGGLGFENAQSGDINFSVAENLTISDSSAIANAVFQFGVGNSGDIIIKTGSLSLQNAGQIFTGIFGLGNAGKVDIKANQGITVEGQTVTGSFNSLISSNVFNGGIGTSAGIVIETTSLSITNGGQIGASVFGEGNAGAIQIKASQEITINGESITDSFSTGIFGTVFGVGTTGGVIIDTGFLSLTNGGQISTFVFGEGNTGGVQIKADEGITIQGESMSNSSFFTGIFSSVGENGIGTSGAIVIDTTTLSLADGGEIGAVVFGEGDAGAINIKADQGITIDGKGIVNGETFSSGIFSNVLANGVGTTGGIFIDTTNLSLINGGQIVANIFGKGDAGVVQIKANEGISIDGETSDGSVIIVSGIFSEIAEDGEGNAGGIDIDTGSLSLTNGGEISATTFDKGDAEAVQIKASEGITVDGEASDGRYSSIFSAGGTDAEGDSKGIVIDTTTLSLTNGAEISTSISGIGKGGEVKITATEGIIIDGETREGDPSGIFSRLNDENAVGSSGTIVIDTTTLSLTNGGEITSSTFGTGDAGIISINASEDIIIDGETSTGILSGIFSQVFSDAVGKSGGIVIDTTNLSISNGGTIRANTLGTGDAGKIEINASGEINIDGTTRNGDASSISSLVDEEAIGNSLGIFIDTTTISLTNGGEISTSTLGDGNAGEININASQQISLSGTNFNSILDREIGGISAFTLTTGKAGDITINTPQLTISEGASIEAFSQGEGEAGDIIVKATDSIILNSDTKLIVESNDTGTAGNINLDTPLLTVGENAQLSATATETSTAEKAGDINLKVNQLNISGELGIFAETQSTPEAGRLTIQPYETNPNLNIQFTDEGFISARTTDIGDGGSITINAPETIDIRGLGSITAETSGEGNAGNINIDTANLTIADGTTITTSTESSGNAGLITLNTTESINLTNQAQITSEVREDATGRSEGIVINTPILSISDRSQISAATEGEKKAGDITITASDSVTIDDNSLLNVQTNSIGKAGNIEITTNTLTIGEDSELSAKTTLNATGEAGTITINANFLDITGELGIFAETDGIADAGSLNINPNDNPNLAITFFDEGQISASTSNAGDGGDININAPQTINLKGNGTIKVETTGTGNAGDINFKSQQLNISEGVTISALTSGDGEAGSIKLNIGDEILIDSGTTFTVETDGDKDAGDIKLAAKKITIGEDAELSARSKENATGKAGNIQLTTNNLTIFGEKGIFAETLGEGEGGSIIIQPLDNNLPLQISFFENGFISASTSGSKKAGNINLSAPNTIKISGDGIIKVETEGVGDAGSILIESNEINLTNGIEISASTSNLGNSKDITLKGNVINLNDATIKALTTGEGNPGSILISNGENNANQVDLTNSKISTEISFKGDRYTTQPANISIESENLSLQSSQITASTNSNRNAGNIKLNNNNINLDNGKITAITSSSGDGGSIDIPDGDNINLINDSEISASTTAEGNAGSLELKVNQIVIIDSGSKLKVETSSRGDAGAITINTPTITIGENAELSARSTNLGKAGNVTLKINQLNISGELGIFAETEGKGKGGNLIINPQINHPDLQINFSNQGKISASTLGSGDGGDINITAPFTINIDGNGSIKVETQGEGNAGDIEIVTQNLNITEGIEITASTLVDENTTTSNIERGNAGNIILDANNINLDDSQINAFTNSTGNAGNINLYYREENSDNITLTNSTISTEIRNNGVADEASNIIIKTNNLTADNSTITASTIGVGDAGEISLFTQQLELNNGSKINAFTNGIGSGGSIEISDNGNQNQSVRLTNNSEISTEIKGNGEANQASSDITIKTNNLVSNDSTITASTQGKGNAGNITIADTQQIELNNSQISTETNGIGNAGQIMIPDTETLYLDHNSKISTAIAKSGIATQPSNIEITASQVFLNNNSQITASTDGQGKAGSINLNIAEDLTFNKNSIISSAAEENASKDGGNITIKTPEMNLNNQSKITVNSDGLIEANAGEININSESITLNNKSQISGSTSAGQGGNLNLNAQQLILENGSQIITTTSGKSQAGNINLIIGEQVIISGFETGILADTTSESTGKGGNITLQTPELLIENGGIIAVDSSGEGEGGVIKIYNQNLTLNKGRISAETRSGDGGDINLTVQEFLTMRNGSKISTTAGNEQTGGNGGNINIFARDIWAIPEENSDITANAFTGKGGQISITTETIFGIEPRNELTSLSDITASSELGVDGIIEITRLNVDPLEGLTNLPETRAEVQVAQGCEVGGEGSISFYDLGLGGLPAQPTYFFRSKPIPWIPLINQKETQQQSWGLTDKTYSVFPATTPIQFKFSCQ